MQNPFKLLGITPFANTATIQYAYQRKMAELLQSDIFDRDHLIKTRLKWEFTLPILEKWRECFTQPQQWREFLEVFQQDLSPEISLLCDEAKNTFQELYFEITDETIVDCMRIAFNKLGNEIEKKLLKLKQLEEARMLLMQKIQREAYRQKSLFSHEVKKITALPEELVNLVGVITADLP